MIKRAKAVESEGSISRL